MVNYLPLDALFEIFMRATIKTLLVCTSVCKLWHSIITSPSFMEAHLNWQKITRDLLIIRTFMRNSQKEVYSWHYDDLALDEVGHNSPYDHPYGNYYRIIDSCNGVLCLVDDHPTYIVDIILWNPAIRVWVKLPPQPVTSRSVVVLEHTTGFGVDPTSNDYKVIRVIYEQNDREVVPKVLMYTLSSSTWKNISHLAVGFGNMITGRSVTQSYLNGVVHWVAWCKKECRLAILSFHLSDEVFHRLELPVGVAITLNNLNGDLRPAVLHRLFSVVEMRRRVKCSVWVMEEYGVETSWVERYSINLRETFERFIGFRKSGRFLVDVQGKLYSYDPLVKDGTERNEKLKDLAIRSQTGHISNSLYALGYFESLVLLGRQTEDSLLLDD